jgi:hypothetical protein
MLESALMAMSFALVSALMLGAAWLALGEYRKLFRENPRLLMSLEVFAVVTRIGGAGYLAAVLAFFGAWLLALAGCIVLLSAYELVL